jgi:tetratricopeptide (TPR) repeat protein/transcriptional regulator with XRE-family HTH domain
MIMKNRFQLAEVLGRYVSRAGYTAGQLSRLSGVPQATITNWLEGRVKKPHHWDALLQVAEALHLTEMEATELLQAAGHPAIEELMVLARDETEKTLLAPWAKIIQRREQAPFQAIADLPYFVGREKALQELKEALLGGQRVAICGLQGMGGVGKTVLAAHAAYLFRPYFPDGVLWARVDKADTMSVLSAFASAYERDVSQYTDVESRSQVVRELLAHKRALMVLDNAQASEEVRPLLPPTGTCGVIITTRRHDLTVIQGVQRIHLGEFDRDKDESLALFTKLLGEAWVRREKAALSEIAELLGHLPLAVTIAASRLAYEPGWSATDFLRRLRQEKRRLGELVYEDQDVRVSFDLSYKTLSPKLQHFFTSLGVFGGEDFSVEAVAYVTKLSLEVAHDNLRMLHSLSLLQQGRLGRYRLHPLLQDFALDRINNEKPLFESMVDYFVQYVATHETDYEALDLEAGNVFTALQTASELGMASTLVKGVNSFFHFLKIRGLYAQAETYLNQARAAAQSVEDKSNLMTVWRNLGQIARSLGDYAQAESYLHQGLQLARQSEHPGRVSALLAELGRVIGSRGDHRRAEGYFQEGLALARKVEDKRQINILLTALGIVQLRRGNYIQAEAHFQEGLALARELGHRDRICALIGNLGLVVFNRGHYERAEVYYQEALTLMRQIGNREGIIIMLSNLGEVALKGADYEKAQAYLQEGLTLARQVESRPMISILLRHLGRAAIQRKAYGQAESYLQESLTLASEIRHHENISAAFKDLGILARELGDDKQAETYLRESLALARQVGEAQFLCELLSEWGNLCLKIQDVSFAADAFHESLKIAQEIGNQECVAVALYGLAHVAAAQGNLAEASRQGQQSLATFEAIGHRNAATIKKWLTHLPHQN